VSPTDLPKASAAAVVSSIVVDARDPSALASFWRALLGGEVLAFHRGQVMTLRAPGVTFDFVRNDDAKEAKNRLHVDVASDDPDGTVAAALDLGASRAADVCASEEHFVVLRDPEGNEFCVLRGMPASRPWQPLP
jgi:catechol-2,3-dioxygenase